MNPLADLDACADEVRSFCIKDHRIFPTDQDCGPGFGEIDHYRLLHRVAFTGRDHAPVLREHLRPRRAAADEAGGSRRAGPAGTRVPGTGD